MTRLLLALTLIGALLVVGCASQTTSSTGYSTLNPATLGPDTSPAFRTPQLKPVEPVVEDDEFYDPYFDEEYFYEDWYFDDEEYLDWYEEEATLLLIEASSDGLFVNGARGGELRVEVGERVLVEFVRVDTCYTLRFDTLPYGFVCHDVYRDFLSFDLIPERIGEFRITSDADPQNPGKLIVTR